MKHIDFDEILTEWSYKLPKGFPTVVNGKFVDVHEIKVLNEILKERGVEGLPYEDIQVEAVQITQLSSDPTDVKEAFVCLFADAELASSGFFTLYRKCLDKETNPADRKKTVNRIQSILKSVASSYGKNYGIPGYSIMPDFTAQVLLEPQTNKKDLVILNNGVSAADAIVAAFKNLQAGMVRRDELFESIRAHAVKLIETNYKIKGYYPDNWCPGDIYFILNEGGVSKILKTERLNVGENSLNSYFYGSKNIEAPILAVSLKMQKAQAGKGTTFIKNVVVSTTTPEDKLGKDKSSQQVIKFGDIKRRLQKYYISNTSWQDDLGILEKVRSAAVQLSKFVDLPGLPTKSNQVAELRDYLGKNNDTIQKAIQDVNNQLKDSVDTATIFRQAYTRFVNNLKALGIQKVEGESADFVNQIEARNRKDNKGELDTAKLQGILSQKAATYDLASTLIEKWTEETKKISPAFADYLDKVKNPFVAITLFAIAQHGLNPNFYKAIGRNDGGKGILSEFPSNSVVDEEKSVSQIKVVDSPGQAGFYVEYYLNINTHTYRTTLTFRFSKDQIRVEVEELEAE